MLYAEAADLYQQVVDLTGGSEEELLKLADSYLKLNEYIDAELTYEKLFKMSPNQSQEVILKYAQVLAQNERYDESQKYYEKFTKDPRGKRFSEAYKSLNKFYRDSSMISVKFLPINTLQAEYSPAIYEKGLVFSSNRNTGTGVKRVYGWNNTPYTDLYYLSDTSALNNESLTKLALEAQNNHYREIRFNSDYTAAASNDSKTLGHYDPYYLTPEDLVTLEVEPFGKNINTKYHEGPVAFTKKYDTLFFTRNSYSGGTSKKGENGEVKLQIFYAIRGENGKYQHVQAFPFNNPDYSVAHPALSPDGKRLYFVSDKGPNFGETDIFYCDIREHRFTEPKNAGTSINTTGSELFPYFNQDGSLYFASDGHAGLGGLDIFRAEVQNDQFQTPSNVGFPINSSKDDFGICTSNLHGTTGYFSSNRMGGRGDDNIFSFTDSRPQSILITGVIKIKHFDEDGRMYIEPLQGATVSLAPYNDKVTTDRTGKYEFVVSRGKIYTIEGEKANLGKDKKEINLLKTPEDVHSYTIDLLLEDSAPVVPYTSTVKEAKTGNPIADAYVYIYEMESESAEKIKTDNEGKFTAQLHPNRNYIIKSSADGYFSDCYKLQTLSDLKRTVTLENLQLQKIQVNSTFEVKNLLYDYNKSEISKDGAEVLDKVVRFLKDYPEVEIEIGSHTDARGNDEYNQKLSSDRAQAALNYIVSQGIDSSRITAKGYGESQLLNKCKNNIECPEEEHQQNRRTEVKVTGIKQDAASPEEEANREPEEVFRFIHDFSDCKQYRVGQ